MEGKEILRKLTHTSAPISHFKIVIKAKEFQYPSDHVTFSFGYCDTCNRVAIHYFPMSNTFEMEFFQGIISSFNLVKRYTDVQADLLTSTFEKETGLMI